MTTQLATDLSAAKALIDTPEKWTQGTVARDANGEMVEHARDAVCLCAFGACRVAIGPYADVSPLMEALRRAIPTENAAPTTVSFNDHPDTTHDDVMALFDRAIAVAEGNPS